MTLLVYKREMDVAVVILLQEGVRAVMALLGFPGVLVISQ